MLLLGVLFLVSSAATAEVSLPESNLDVYVINPSYSNHGYHPHHHQKIHNVRNEILQGPVLILAPSKEKQTELVAYYADHGLKSVVDHKNFDPLHQLLRKSGPVSGLLLSYHAFNGNQFLLTAVSDFILPDGFRVSDIVRDVQNKAVPILYVAPRKVFNDRRFVGLKLVARFAVGESSVDVVPVHVSNGAAQQFHPNDFHYSGQALDHGSFAYHPSHHAVVYYPKQQARPSQVKPSQEQEKPNQQQTVQK